MDLGLDLADDRQPILPVDPAQEHPVDRVEPGVDQGLKRLRERGRCDRRHDCAPSRSSPRDRETVLQLSAIRTRRLRPSSVSRIIGDVAGPAG